MKPEDYARFEEMYAWFLERKVQQISYPLDEASRNTLGTVTTDGPGGSSLTQSIVTSGPTATVPAAYVGTIIIDSEGAKYEVPYISTP
jgi:hypothetical protein